MTNRTRWAVAAVITLTVVLHAAPLVSLWDATDRSLVPWASAETYLYTTLSHLEAGGDGLVRNPWYGNSMPGAQAAYVRFGLALRVFHRLSLLTGGDAMAMITWHALLALAIGLALVWMLRAARLDGAALVAAFAVVMFVDAAYARYDLGHLRGGAPGWIYGFPFARVFYPQVGVPFLFVSLGCMLRWMADPARYRWLIAVALLQYAAFFAFPFASVAIVGGVGVIAACAVLLRAIDWRAFFIVMCIMAASLGADGISLAFAGGGPVVAGSNDLLKIDLSQVHVTQTIVFPLLLGVLALLPWRLDARLRSVFGGFAIAVALMQLADAVVTPALQFGHHIAYFYSVAFWLPLVAIGMAAATRLRAATSRVVATAVVAVILIFATLDARATASAWRLYNRDNGQLARALMSIQATDQDVVLVPVPGFHGAESPTREAPVVPLVSSATVLYSPAGRFLLPPGSPEDPERLSAYLFFTGEGASSVDAALRVSPTTNEQHVLAGYGREFFLGSSARESTLADIRQELVPRLEALAQGARPQFLRAARRLIVADSRDAPVFRTDRVNRFLVVDSVIDTGPWRIQIGRVRD